MVNGGSSNQLSTLIHILKRHVSRSDDLSLVTGLSIVKSLEGFTYKPLNQDMKLQEVQAVYGGLNESIHRINAGKSINGVITSHLDYIQPIIQDPSRSSAHTEMGSHLLRHTLNTLERGQGSFSDQIRNRASKLIYEVRDYKPVSNPNKDVALRDYHALQTEFANAGGRR